MKARTKIRCAGCNKRITRGELDLILQRMSEANHMVTVLRLVYHVRCKNAALEHVQGEPPAFWRMAHRYVNAEAN